MSNSSSAAPAPTTLEGGFTPAPVQTLFKGEGGTQHSVDGIEIWTIGRRSKVNRGPGDLSISLHLDKNENEAVNITELEPQVESYVADAAHKMGADAAIPMSIWAHIPVGMLRRYRLIQYLRGDVPSDMTVKTDDAILDADGMLAPNGSEVGITIGPPFPFLAKYYCCGVKGKVIVHVCVDRKGVLTQPVSVSTTSGHTVLDQAAIRAASVTTFHPATVNGGAVDRCSDFQMVWR
jgi:TonB family protein